MYLHWTSYRSKSWFHPSFLQNGIVHRACCWTYDWYGLLATLISSMDLNVSSIPSMYTIIPILGSYTTVIWIQVPTVTVDFDSRWGSAKIIQTRMVFCRGNPMRIEWPLSLLVICMNLPWANKGFTHKDIAVVDLRGREDAHPPGGPNSFNSNWENFAK